MNGSFSDLVWQMGLELLFSTESDGGLDGVLGINASLAARVLRGQTAHWAASSKVNTRATCGPRSISFQEIPASSALSSAILPPVLTGPLYPTSLKQKPGSAGCVTDSHTWASIVGVEYLQVCSRVSRGDPR